MNKEKLLDIFSRINKEDINKGLHKHSKVLIIDGMNTFIRSFAVGTKMNLLGHEINGLVGFLKSLGSAIKILSPTKVIIVFDGEGGSNNRRYLYPEYKGKRDNTRIINYKSFSNKEDEDVSHYNQIVRLIDYLKVLPVTCISIDRLEADDVMGYLTQYLYNKYSDCNITLMSTDKDYLQLVSDRVKVYSPTKKKIYEVSNVLEEFKVHPHNFLLYRVLVGDTSDSIPGVMGFGESNTPKLFEILKDSENRTLQDIYDICESPPKKSVLYDRVLNTQNQVEVFYNIMDLKNPNIISDDKELILEIYYEPTPPLRKHDFIKMYTHDRMGSAIPNLDIWLNLFSTLNSYN